MPRFMRGMYVQRPADFNSVDETKEAGAIGSVDGSANFNSEDFNSVGETPEAGLRATQTL